MPKGVLYTMPASRAHAPGRGKASERPANDRRRRVTSRVSNTAACVAFQTNDGDTRDVSIPRIVVSVLLLLALRTQVAALEPQPLLRVDAPPELHVGARVSIPVSVRVPPGDTTPVLLSATASGRAIDVVKGRLLRADAIDPRETPLRFELPVIAATAGVALLRVSVLTYRCNFRCEAVRTESTLQVLVRER